MNVVIAAVNVKERMVLDGDDNIWRVCETGIDEQGNDCPVDEATVVVIERNAIFVCVDLRQFEHKATVH